jgi:hypothetical protein
VKDEGFNLNAMTDAINSIVSYEALGLKENFLGTCYGHFFFLKHVNMPQQMKKFVESQECFYQVYTRRFFKLYHLAQKIQEEKVGNMFLSRVHKEILRSASLGPKNLGGKGRSEIEFVLILEFSQQNLIP